MTDTTNTGTGSATDTTENSVTDGQSPLVGGPRGMELLEFHREPEDTVFADARVGYVLVALWHQDRLLMVRVRGRDCWELPGGKIDPGETPRQAAVRELREESGQEVAPERLRFAGFARTVVGPERRMMYGALFTAETDAPAPFTPCEEIAAAHWREGSEPLEGGAVQTVDEYLAALCRP
ncbi:NUDIX domain-containing protein [Streptomyces pini]|uniref:ADP-ribose pyrophosphatase YjhB, NUDIX family n=1 Tax=Streptomyces pini TaxID=1520580 RepID=A0A1I4C7Z4_9ACTN|nr:NUDIX domain-containing protein [Streptomyces pini]SFK76306.1 ADP-ribose pyrophosphatase YjhB, NUDIX family [Streptomyces pini]